MSSSSDNAGKGDPVKFYRLVSQEDIDRILELKKPYDYELSIHSEPTPIMMFIERSSKSKIITALIESNYSKKDIAQAAADVSELSPELIKRADKERVKKFVVELYNMRPDANFDFAKAKEKFEEKWRLEEEEAKEQGIKLKREPISPIDELTEIDPELKSAIEVAAEMAGYIVIGKRGEVRPQGNKAMKEASEMNPEIWKKLATFGAREGQKERGKEDSEAIKKTSFIGGNLHKLVTAIRSFISAVLKKFKNQNFVDKNPVIVINSESAPKPKRQVVWSEQIAESRGVALEIPSGIVKKRRLELSMKKSPGGNSSTQRQRLKSILAESPKSLKERLNRESAAEKGCEK